MKGNIGIFIHYAFYSFPVLLLIFHFMESHILFVSSTFCTDIVIEWPSIKLKLKDNLVLDEFITD